MRAAILTCIQRCKEMNFEFAEHGIRITLETQDDYGYYTYAFDVFPGRTQNDET